MKRLELSVFPQRFAVCRLEPDAEIPGVVSRSHFWSVTRTDEELSVVLPEANVPGDWTAEKG